MHLLLVVMMCLSFTYASAQGRIEVPVLDGSNRPVGVVLSPEIVIPDGSTRVGVYIGRAAFLNPQSEVGVVIKALVDEEWVVIKRPQGRIKGGRRDRPRGGVQAESYTFTSIPPGATHVRVEVSVVGRAASIPTKVVFE